MVFDAIASVIGSGLSFWGNERTNAANKEMQDAANSSNWAIAQSVNKFNAEEAQKNRDYQTMMSNSAYQRSMADMKAAGLNPMLAFSQGGASSPSGATATGTTGAAQQATRFENSIEKGVSSAKDALRLSREMKAADAQIGLNEAATDTQKTQAQLNSNSAKAAEANAAKANADAAIMKAQLPAIKAQARNEKTRADMESNPAIQATDAVIDRVGKAAGIIRNAVPSRRKHLEPGEYMKLP